jgi:hypothetical protein
MIDTQFLDLDNGPRHRQVVRTRRLPFPWVRVALTVLTGAALFWFLLVAAGVAHAAPPPAAGACVLESTVLAGIVKARDEGQAPDVAAGSAAQQARAMELSKDFIDGIPKTTGRLYTSRGITPDTIRRAWQGMCPTASATIQRQRAQVSSPCDRQADIAYSLAMMRDADVRPKLAYQRAVQQAEGYGLNPAPLEALTWRVYVNDGPIQPAAIRHAVRYECRRVGGVL